MIDLSDTVSGQAPESEDMILERLSSDDTNLKTCVDCGTTKTPLWRGGPAGPKSLCNACGIRSRKKRRAQMGIKKEDKKPKKATINKHKIFKINITSSSNNSSSNEERSIKNDENSLKKKLLDFSGKLAYQRPRSTSINQRPRSTSINQRRKLGEVEQAAFLLMALSCGSFYV